MCQGTFERATHPEPLPLMLESPELLLAVVVLLELLPPLSSRPLSSWTGRSLVERVISSPSEAPGGQQQPPREAAHTLLPHALLLLELAAAAAAAAAAPAAAAPPELGGATKRDFGRPPRAARVAFGVERFCWRSVVHLPLSWDGCARQYPLMVFCDMVATTVAVEVCAARESCGLDGSKGTV